MDEISQYNEKLSKYGGCIFLTVGGYGYYYNGKFRRGFKTAEEAYIDICGEIEGRTK
jgi:hypothetical protein